MDQVRRYKQRWFNGVLQTVWSLQTWRIVALHKSEVRDQRSEIRFDRIRFLMSEC